VLRCPYGRICARQRLPAPPFQGDSEDRIRKNRLPPPPWGMVSKQAQFHGSLDRF